MRFSKFVWLVGIVIVAVLSAAFCLGYFTRSSKATDEGIPESAQGVAPVPVPAKASPVKGAVVPTAAEKPAVPTPEQQKVRAERRGRHEEKMRARLEREGAREEAQRKRASEEYRRKVEKEAWPDELRYRHHARLPEHLQRRIELDRERRALQRQIERHPERAERLEKRLKELDEQAAALEKGGRKISEVRKVNDPPKRKE